MKHLEGWWKIGNGHSVDVLAPCRLTFDKPVRVHVDCINGGEVEFVTKERGGITVVELDKVVKLGR